MSTREMQIAHKGRISGSRQEGSALIAALLFLVVSTAVAAGIAALASSAAETSADLLDSERAFYAAESARMRGVREEFDLDGDVHGDSVSDSPGELGCEPGETVYRGWVGSDWENAEARHAICALTFPNRPDPSEADWEELDGPPWKWGNQKDVRKLIVPFDANFPNSQEHLEGDHGAERLIYFEGNGEPVEIGNVRKDSDPVIANVCVDGDVTVHNKARFANACYTGQNAPQKGSHADDDELHADVNMQKCDSCSDLNVGSWDYADFSGE